MAVTRWRHYAITRILPYRLNDFFYILNLITKFNDKTIINKTKRTTIRISENFNYSLCFRLHSGVLKQDKLQ